MKRLIFLLLFQYLLTADGFGFLKEEEGAGDLAIPEDARNRPDHPKNMLKESNVTREPGYYDCYCSYGTEEGICLEGEVCRRDEGAACFHATEERFNDDEHRMETLHMYGCATLEKGSGASHLTCKSYLIHHSIPRSIACCYEGYKCNLNIIPPPYTGFEPDEYDPEGPIERHSSFPFIAISVPFIIAICFAVSFILWKRHQRSKRGEKIVDCGREDEKDLMIDLSGSGSCGATLSQRTIAQDLTIIKVIGRGRYGEVRKALYRGSYVAVKTFYTTDEESWENEKEIYHTVMFNHENVLQFVAADICSEDSITQMLLITDYHELGSLSEYLQEKELITAEEAIHLAHSIMCGLEHLHKGVYGTDARRKPQIAHRDLKSKNVIVKRKGVCCIADFGLAVRFDRQIIPSRPKVQVGTKRYMAPEVLARTLDPSLISHFKMADMYAIALVFWEILSRIELDVNDTSSPIGNRRAEASDSSGLGESLSSSNKGNTPKAHHHKQSIETSSRMFPFGEIVSSDPTFDEMKKIVCDNGQRPPIQEEWKNSRESILPVLTAIVEDCWNGIPEVRRSALRVKLDLIKAIEEYNKNQAKKFHSLERTEEIVSERKDSGITDADTVNVHQLPV